MRKIAIKCLVAGLFLLCFSWTNLTGSEFKKGSWCCARNCTPGKEAPPKFMNTYSDKDTNERHCVRSVNYYCGGEGYVCGCSRVNPESGACDDQQ